MDKIIWDAEKFDYFNALTLGGRVPIFFSYRDDSQIVSPKRYYLSDIALARQRVAIRDVGYYGATDRWLYHALSVYGVGEKVLVVGSQEMWYEAIAFEFGAKTVEVSEYQDVECECKEITYIKPEELAGRLYDAIINISSIEHAGLGRYGDPLDANGDIKEMERLRSVLKPGGRMFMAVPIGHDRIVWNLHRIYGRKMFNRLTAGWDVFDTIGEFEYKDRLDSCHQPVVVMK